jgi:diaminohydroxyphosphoribosylaminopyrimidine deaminase / 5-amino-6-(5-phosphoribosylamino)uracil reductase
VDDGEAMARAVALAREARPRVTPRAWVGAVLVTANGTAFEGVTEPVPGPHAELAALAAAGEAARGATLYTTLEPCSHTTGRSEGFTTTCADAVVAAGVSRVVVALEDPDPRVSGSGFDRLRAAGIDVEVGLLAEHAAADLAPYLKHRRTGRPYVVLKLAASLDGRTAAPDGTSRWITGDEARADAHRLRALSDAVVVGAGTVRADDPELTVRHVEGRNPLRVVLGKAPAAASVHPALELDQDPDAVLDELGRRGILQAMVEGGATVAGAFHRAGLVDRYVVYLAPALFGGDDARGLFAGPGAATMDDVWRGRITSVERLGDDLRVELAPAA